MSIAHRVVGYDKRTEKLAYEFALQGDQLEQVRQIARAPEAQDETFGSLPLDTNAARSIAGRLDLPMNVDTCDWFFEPFAE